MEWEFEQSPKKADSIESKCPLAGTAPAEEGQEIVFAAFAQGYTMGRVASSTCKAHASD